MSDRFEAAAICTPGLEPFVETELRALGIKPKPGHTGVVEFKASARQLYAANVWLRTASRVLVRIATFRATDFAHLQQRAEEVDWSSWITDDVAPEFRVSSRKSRLYHTQGIADRLHKVVGPASIGEAGQPFVVRFDRDLCSVSIDASGTPLNHRAWRTDIGVAPLRPTMAAAVLMAAGYDGTEPLVDPFCGCGTIPIEAALLAAKLPPGGTRRFAFQQWPSFQRGTWASVQGEVKAAAQAGVVAQIEAYDRDQAAVDACKANAERAQVSDSVLIERKVVSHLGGHTGKGLIVSNPPYGKRVGDGDLRALYKKFGAVMRQRRPQWGLAMVVADVKLARVADHRLAPVGGFGHGGMTVSVLSRPGSEPSEPSAPLSDPDLQAR